MLNELLPEPDVIVAEGVAQLNRFDVWLDGFEPARKVAVIKDVRQRLTLSLIDAKQLVESAPRVVGKGLPLAAAEALRQELAAAGAHAAIRPMA